MRLPPVFYLSTYFCDFFWCKLLFLISLRSAKQRKHRYFPCAVGLKRRAGAPDYDMSSNCKHLQLGKGGLLPHGAGGLNHINGLNGLAGFGPGVLSPAGKTKYFFLNITFDIFSFSLGSTSRWWR